MNSGTFLVTIVGILLCCSLAAQTDYPDTIYLETGDWQAVKVDNIRKKRVYFYMPEATRMKHVKFNAIDSLVLASDMPFYAALKSLHYGRSTWIGEGTEQNKDADSRDLNQRMALWLDHPAEYPNSFEIDETDEPGVIRGSGELRLSASLTLSYNLTLQTFGNNYTYRISDPTLSTGESLRDYIRTYCYRGNGAPRLLVPDYNQSVITKSAEALKEMTDALELVLGS